MELIAGLPKFELGNQIEIAGMVLQGKGKTYNIMFPTADKTEYEFVYPSQEEWKKILFQLDTLEVELFLDKPKEAKVVVRKSQRNIEQGISWNVFRRDNYTCRYCASNNVPLTVDHLVLWENMGQTVEENLISACRKCNKTRGNTKFEKWIESEYYKNKISNFEDPIQAHKYNLNIWELAQKLPLRTSLRSR